MPAAAVEAPLRFDPNSAEFRNNMIAIYERFLREEPVHRLPDGRWLLTRHRDVSMALTDHKRFRRPHEWTAKRHGGEGPLQAWAAENMIALNPPDHTRFRKAIARLFMPKAVEGMRGMVERTTAELIAQMPYDENFDFIEKFAYPLPVSVICNMMGIPSSDHHLFGHSTGAIIAGIEVFATPEARQHGEEAVIFLRDYLGDIAKKRETEMGDDIISVLVKNQQEDQLSRSEVVHAAISLLMAGHETTTHLLGNGLIALIRNPDQLQRLRADRGLLATAIDEFLRYDPSLYTGYRMTNEEVRIDDHVIPKDAFVFLSYAGANRDPEVFENPGKLDVGRANASRHVSFGGGQMLCLGYMLARMEGRIAFDAILSNFGKLELTGEPTPRDGLVFKGCMKIPVRFGRPEMKAAAE